MFDRDGSRNDPPHALKSTVEIWGKKGIWGTIWVNLQMKW
jgi:hypothetical protein